MAINVNGIRGDVAMHEGRYEDAVRLLGVATDAVRAFPGGAPVDSPIWLVFALAATGATDEAAATLSDARAVLDLRIPGRAVLLAAADALLHHDADAIDAALATAPVTTSFQPALVRVIAAEVIGGDHAARWLREAYDIYDAGGSQIRERVRALLRAAGAPVPRRRRATAEVPPALAEQGVTAREAEVARLVGTGLANADIARELYLSVRTVEAHVSSLLAKLHCDSRAQLIVLLANGR
jgi:DNA-binding NarL/FixJ family response regulator